MPNCNAIQSLKEHGEFHNFLDQNVLMEPQWPDCNIIRKMLVRLYDTKRRVYADPKTETQVNAAMTGPCFNCKGEHLFKNCRRFPNKCSKCGKFGHLEEFYRRLSNKLEQRDDRSQDNRYPITHEKSHNGRNDRPSKYYPPRQQTNQVMPSTTKKDIKVVLSRSRELKRCDRKPFQHGSREC